MESIENVQTAVLPRYRCHKEVGALKIARVELLNDGGEEFAGRLHFEDPGYAPHFVAPAWLKKHLPVQGGYYVVYADGYSSFSPPGAFEEGYTRI